MSAPHPYVRPVARTWWARPPYLAYTLREGAGAIIALYGIVLLWGVIALARGPAAYGAWLDFMRGPVGVVLHIVIFAAMVLHARTWFQIMPKTMPRIVIKGQVLAQATITRAGFWVAIATNVLLLLLMLLVRP